MIEQITAAGEKEGWKLVTVIDNGTTKPYYSIAGVRMSDGDAKQFVLGQAVNRGSDIHKEAIRLVMSSRAANSTKRKKK